MFRRLYGGEDVVLGTWDCADPHRDWGPVERAEGHELVVPVHGCLARERDREVVVATPNTALLANPGDAYRFRHPDGTRDRCAVVLLDPRAMEDLARTSGTMAIGFPLASFHLPASGFFALGRLLKAFRDGPEPDDLQVGEIIGAILTFVTCTPRPPAGRTRSPADARRQRRAVNGAVELMASGFRGPLTLGRVAREVAYSPFHFSRIFRRHTGLTVHGYLARLRLRAAVEALLQGEDDLSRLALGLGFSSHSHFTDAFRREFGVPPSQVRDLGDRSEKGPARRGSIPAGKRAGFR